MAKGKHTPSKRKRNQVFKRAEADHIAGLKRHEARKKALAKRTEAATNGQERRPTHNPTISNLTRVRDAILRREEAKAKPPKLEEHRERLQKAIHQFHEKERANRSGRVTVKARRAPQ